MHRLEELAHEALRGEDWQTMAPLSPIERIEAADALLVQAERVLHERVDAARRAGVTWQAIGDALTITRQAAHERFSGRL